jgi:hypothetical protein
MTEFHKWKEVVHILSALWSQGSFCLELKSSLPTPKPKASVGTRILERYTYANLGSFVWLLYIYSFHIPEHRHVSVWCLAVGFNTWTVQPTGQESFDHTQAYHLADVAFAEDYITVSYTHWQLFSLTSKECNNLHVFLSFHRQSSSIIYSRGSLTLLGRMHLKICAYSKCMATLMCRDVSHKEHV